MSLLFLFHDGVGVGEANPEHNPFMRATIPTWRALAGGRWPTLTDPGPHGSAHATLLGADATLGIVGEPQSGTGTTALLTGLNAPALLGKHAGPYPPAEIRPLLQEHNLLSRARARDRRIAYANAFPPFYFDRLARGKARRTTCTQAALAAGLTLRNYEDLVEGNALSGWITNEHWRRISPEVPEVTPFEAGRNLGSIARDNDVTLFEYFLTDHRGHRPDMARARMTLRLLDGFIAGITSTLDPHKDTLVMAADHGNFEAQEHSSHTRNPALVTLWGRGHETMSRRIAAITDIVPALLELLSGGT